MSKTYEALKRAEAARSEAVRQDTTRLAAAVEAGAAPAASAEAILERGARVAPEASAPIGDPGNLGQQGFDIGSEFGLLTGADEYFEVRRSLRSAAIGVELKTILVVSSLHGEGASTVVCQFARAMADGGRCHVLLSDLNMRTPSLRRLMRVLGQKGFMNVVADDEPLDNVIQASNVEGVSVITAGSGRYGAIEILDTDKAPSVVNGLAEAADLVFADAPPVTLYPDARALAPLFDGVVLVVEADTTPVSVATRSCQILRDAGANILGVVLNKRKDYIPEVVNRLVG